MIEKDTIRLLRECDSGVKMGISALDEVMRCVSDTELKELLIACREEHDVLDKEIQRQLTKYKDEGKDPNPMIKGMSRMKTNMKLVMNETDATIADLITDGCNMGVKSLHRYLNEYKAADELSKDIAKRLIQLEDKLAMNMRIYL